MNKCNIPQIIGDITIETIIASIGDVDESEYKLNMIPVAIKYTRNVIYFVSNLIHSNIKILNVLIIFNKNIT